MGLLNSLPFSAYSVTNRGLFSVETTSINTPSYLDVASQPCWCTSLNTSVSVTIPLAICHFCNTTSLHHQQVSIIFPFNPVACIRQRKISMQQRARRSLHYEQDEDCNLINHRHLSDCCTLCNNRLFPYACFEMDEYTSTGRERVHKDATTQIMTNKRI